MKKIFAAVIALSLCGVMLTACGTNNGAADVVDETTTASSEAAVSEETTAETEAETTTEAETEAETEASDAASSDNSFASLDELAAADLTSLACEAVAYKDSFSCDFANSLKGATALYIDMEDTKGAAKVAMGIEGNNIFMDMYEAESDTKLTIIIKDKVMYMLDTEAKEGFYYEVDDETLGDYDMESMFKELQIDDEDIDEQAEVTTYAVEVGGTAYTLETSGESGMLFNADGKLSGMFGNDDVFIVNDFTAEIPEGLFDIPEDYQLVDMAAALSEAGAGSDAQ